MVLLVSLPPLGGPDDAPPGGGVCCCVLPVEAMIVPKSEGMLSRSWNSELSLAGGPLTAGGGVLPVAGVEALLLVAADAPPVKLAISDCRSASSDATPLPPAVPVVSSGDPTVCVVEPLPVGEPLLVVEPLPVVEPVGSRPPPKSISIKLVLLDSGEAVLAATGLTTVGSAAVVPALLGAGPPPWPDGIAGGV